MSTLYDVLLTLARLMAPFTPFFAEYLYQNLRILGGLSSERATEKTLDPAASVHFQEVPSFDATRLDDEIESQVACLQEVIDLGRIVREKKKISMKMPVKEVIIVSRDQKKLAACKKLEKYLYQELNVMKVSTTDEESKWCTFSARTDGKVLGKRLGKNFGKVRNYVDGQKYKHKKGKPKLSKAEIVEFEKSKLTHDQVLEYEKNGQVEIEGETILAGELIITRQFSGDKSIYEADSTKLGDIVLIIDVRVDDEMQKTYLAREVVNRIQKIRKNIGLDVSDEVNVFYSVVESEGSEKLLTAIRDRESVIIETIRTSIKPLSSKEAQAVVIGSEDCEIGDVQIKISLTRANAIQFADAKLKEALGEDASDETIAKVKQHLASTSKLPASGQYEVSVDGITLQLEAGLHFY